MTSKKHYVAVAETVSGLLAVTPDCDERRGIELLVERLANIYADDNPNFNRNRFLKACGL